MSPKLLNAKTQASDFDDPVDIDATAPKGYVTHILQVEQPLPSITWKNWYTEVDYLNIFFLVILPIVGFIASWFHPPRAEILVFMFFYGFVAAISVTTGYHRLWAHRAYNASRPLQYFLALAGAGALQGPIKQWARSHRAHHRYTDTELDPYNARKGFLWSHIAWALVKHRQKPGFADISDLIKNDIVMWQDRHYGTISFTVGFGIPALIPWVFWDDLLGGLIYACVIRMFIVHQSIFCVNSVAHWLGHTSFDDKHTPRDHFITGFLTLGEGFHNFHHQFPMDYRNGVKWYHGDPTKWLIWTCSKLGLASNLKVFPDNEIRKGELTMQLKKLRRTQDQLQWPTDSNDLPVISWQSFQDQSRTRPLVLISGFIHDISGFMDKHPGGAELLKEKIGKDASTAFSGGIYDHSNAAHNLLAMKRVGILKGGHPHVSDEAVVPPGQRLKIVKYGELGHPQYVG